MARIAVGGFHHETNTFVATKTDFAYFCLHRDRPPYVRRAAVLEWLGSVRYPLSGFMAATKGRHELVPLVWGSGGAGGYVTSDAFERIAGEMIGELSQIMPVDAVYLDLHGAMVTEDFEDGEGELLRRVPATVGPAMPVVVSLDYHSNVTPEMTQHADAVIAYETYPHVDRFETGERAAQAMDVLLKDGKRPAGRVLLKAPFLLPLHAQCTMIDPSKRIVAATAAELKGDVISTAYLAGFPPSDIWHCGPSVVVHGRSETAARRAAETIARALALAEPEFSTPLYSPEEAVAKAKAIAAKAARPVVIADTQDNPGAGGSADTTGLLMALVAGKAEGAALGYFCDSEAVKAAHAAGEGREIRVKLGGRHGPAGVIPFEATFKVQKLGSGKFRTTGPVAGHREVDLGPMAALTIGGVTVALTSKRMQAHDQAPFRHLGIEPTKQKILALKSTVHFRADFEPIAETVLVAVAPGDHLCDPTQYDYKRLRPGVRLLPLGPEWAGPRLPQAR